MGWQAYVTLAVVVLTIGALATERFSAPYVVLAGVTALLVLGVISSEQALSGFSSETPVSIAALYVMAGAAEITGALDRATVLAIGHRPKAAGQRSATVGELSRVLWPTALVSSFIYNTPTTTMLAPQVAAWARRSRRSSSWYLMPFNAAVLFGGMVTGIGTTTNVLITGLLQKSHQPGLSLFEITPVGLPLAVVGVTLTILLAPRLVPTRNAPSDRGEGADPRHFTVEMEVAKSRLVGRTVAEAGLRHLEGVYLVEVRRAGHTIAPVAPSEVLADGDRLTFAGNVSSVLDLQRMHGLVSAEQPHFSVAGNHGRLLYEAVVAAGSPLAGTTPRDIGFRDRYSAAIVAVHREGERVPGKLGSVRLRAGDVLLLLGPTGFPRRWRGQPDFALVARLGEPGPVRRNKAPVVWAVLATFLAVVITGVMPLLNIALISALALIALGVVSPQEARAAIDVDVVIVLAASFGLAAAIKTSGLAEEFARALISAFGGLGDVGVLAAVLLCTAIITQVVTNNATAAVMFPIALATASQLHADPRAFVIALAIGASASFLTPIAYQTNMIVYGMGGYRFRDFSRLGLVLVVATYLVALATIPVFFPFH